MKYYVTAGGMIFENIHRGRPHFKEGLCFCLVWRLRSPSFSCALKRMRFPKKLRNPRLRWVYLDSEHIFPEPRVVEQYAKHCFTGIAELVDFLSESGYPPEVIDFFVRKL